MRPFFLLCTAGMGMWIGSNALAATQAEAAANFAPLDYFNNACARCHGDYGSFYGEGFGKGLTDERMLEVVKEMAEGPAQSPIGDDELKILTGYHIALRDGKPFLHVVSSEKTAMGWKFSGEVSPDSTLMWNGQNVEIKGHKWVLEVTEKGPFLLKATKQEVSQEIDLQQKLNAPQTSN